MIQPGLEPGSSEFRFSLIFFYITELLERRGRPGNEAMHPLISLHTVTWGFRTTLSFMIVFVPREGSRDA